MVNRAIVPIFLVIAIATLSCKNKLNPATAKPATTSSVSNNGGDDLTGTWYGKGRALKISKTGSVTLEFNLDIENTDTNGKYIAWYDKGDLKFKNSQEGKGSITFSDEFRDLIKNP